MLPRTLFLSRHEILLGLIVALMVVAIAIKAPGFAAPANLAGIFNDTAILIILALGQMAVIVTRAIDLSVAANLALTGMVAAMLNAYYPGIPVPLLMALCALLGLGLGAVNGLLVWKLGIPSIVVTLGTMSIYRGMVFLVSGGAWVNAHQMSPSFLGIPRAAVFGLPFLSWLAILAVALVFLWVSLTRSGRALFAAGGAPLAAVYAGIDVGRTQFRAFCLSGALAGFCGYLWVSRFAVAYLDVALGFELDVVAACVIGGVAIAGGVGYVSGVLLGALFLGVVKNALPVIGISPFWQLAISGTVIIVAVLLNARSGRRGRIILKEAQV